MVDFESPVSFSKAFLSFEVEVVGSEINIYFSFLKTGEYVTSNHITCYCTENSVNFPTYQILMSFKGLNKMCLKYSYTF